MENFKIFTKSKLLNDTATEIINEQINVSKIYQIEDIVDLIEKINQRDPQIFIIDTNQIEKSLIPKILYIINHDQCKSRIILASSTINTMETINYLKQGASAVIPRNISRMEMKQCIHCTMNGVRYLTSATIIELLRLLEVSKIQINPSPDRIARQNLRPLTEREIEITNYLVEGRTISWISKKLNRKISTISTIKRNIFDKSKCNNIIDLYKWLGENNK